MLAQTHEESLVAEICVSHAFFVTEITSTFDPSEQHYAGFCAMTAYRLSNEEDGFSDPEVSLELKAYDDYVMTRVNPVF